MFLLCPRHFQLGGGGGCGGVGAYSITAVCTSVPSVRPIRNTIAFSAISFERIGVLD